MVKAIVLTQEKICKEIKQLSEWMEKHKKEYPGCETLNKELGYDLRHHQYLYAEHVQCHLRGLLCNYDYSASEIEIIKEAVIK